eukprot:scaffold2552_cov380-Prasinococcus_capsulatus_cf.AAC.20
MLLQSDWYGTASSIRASRERCQVGVVALHNASLPVGDNRAPAVTIMVTAGMMLAQAPTKHR